MWGAETSSIAARNYLACCGEPSDECDCAKHLVAKEKQAISDITTDVEKTPAGDAPPSESETKPKKSAKRAKPAVDAKAAKGTKPTKKAKATKKPTAAKKGGDTAERSNKKAKVIAMMKRAKGATLAEIIQATGWQKHTVRGYVSILGSKGGEKIESSKNAAGERTYKIRSRLPGKT